VTGIHLDARRGQAYGGPDDLEGILGLLVDRTWIQCACFGDRSICQVLSTTLLTTQTIPTGISG
jgi:hypothetical protein